MTDAPLRGLKVLDLSRVLAGPYATQLLADLGADVIKIEPPEGDETRRFGPPFVRGESTYYLSINRGKRSVAVDLKHDLGRAVVQDLARWADVVFENFRPGVADALGVGYATLAEHNARLVYVSISGYGQRGLPEYARLPGYDVVIQGVGGIASLTGPEQGPPYKMGTSVADLVAGMSAFSGALAALYERERTGRGRRVDIGMLDGQLSFLTYHATATLNVGTRPRRLGNAHPSICPYETFAAKDGFLNVACGNDAQFRSLCQVIDQMELLRDARFASNAERVRHREDLLAVLRPQFLRKAVAEWLSVLEAVKVPCGPILEVPEALAHPQALARGMIVTQEHPSAGAVRSVGCPLGFEQATYAQRPPPRLGEHSDEVLRTVLGYEAERVERCCASGAVSRLNQT